MTSDLLNEDLLKSAWICDSRVVGYSFGSEESVRCINLKNSASKPLANGVGSQCRWMLTDRALIIRLLDGTTRFKACPPGIGHRLSGAYRAAFSIKSEAADLIVICSNERTYIVKVRADEIEEETLVIDLDLLCGFAAQGSPDILLFGQTRRTPVADGMPVSVRLSGSTFLAGKLPKEVGGADLEGIIGVIGSPGRELKICSSRPSLRLFDDFEDLVFPDSSDHDTYIALEGGWDEQQHLRCRLDDVCFVGVGGDGVQALAFFQDLLAGRAGYAEAQLKILASDASVKSCSIHGLPIRSTVKRIQHDPLIGWFGLAEEHNDRRDPYSLHSPDGREWVARRLLCE